MNIYVTPVAPTPEPAPIELSETGEIVMLAILGVAVIGFFGLAYKIVTLDQPVRVKTRKAHFWNR